MNRENLGEIMFALGLIAAGGIILLGIPAIGWIIGGLIIR
jgi:hypothetical protein